MASLSPLQDVIKGPGHTLRLVDGLINSTDPRAHVMVHHHLGLVLLVLFVYDVKVLTYILKVHLDCF